MNAVKVAEYRQRHGTRISLWCGHDWRDWAERRVNGHVQQGIYGWELKHLESALARWIAFEESIHSVSQPHD